MALTRKEQAELDSLQKEVGHLEPQSKGGLTPDEQLEMQSLEQEVGHQASIPQTILEHGANAATMGYLPQLQAMAEPVTNAIGNMVTGNNVEATPYVQARDQGIKRLQEEQQANPKTALASQVGGTILGAAATPIPGLGASKGIVSGMLKGAGGGAAQGFLQNPGDIKGEVDPLQLGDRASNAAKGAAIGGAAGGVTEVAKKGLRALARGPETLKEVATGSAVKASGAILKDFRSLEGKGKTNELGEFALDKGLVKAGDTIDDVAAKADALRQDAGSRLSKIYKGVVEDFNKDGVAEGISSAEKTDLSRIGFNPARDKDQIISEVSKAMGNQEGKKAAVKRLSDYFDQLIEDHGDNTLDPKLAQDIKTEVDKVAGWARNPLTKEPATESAYKEARRIISKKIDEDIDRLGKLSGNNEALSQLKQANKDYGNAKQIMSMATDKAQRALANRRVSLTDTIASGAGGIAGAGMATVTGDTNPAHAAEYGLVGGLLAGGANHLGRKYGDGLIAHGANVASPLLKYSGAPMAARGAGLLMPNPGLVGRSAVNLKGLLKEKQNER